MAPPKGHTATGGVISDYIEPGPGNIYRAHIFTESGTFDVTVLGELYGNTVEYLVVAGGGGGGANVGGGGGAGGMRTGSTTVSASPGTHPVVIGGGGFSVLGNGPQGGNGSPSVFNSAVEATGGGGGGAFNGDGQDGGS